MVGGYFQDLRTPSITQSTNSASTNPYTGTLGTTTAEAISKLSEHAFPPPTTPRSLLSARLVLAHDQAIAHGRVVEAEHITEGLLQLADPVNYLGMPLRLEAHRTAVQNLIASGSLSEANTLAIDLFCKYSQAGMQVEAVQSLLLLAEIHLAAENPLGALPYALSCLLHTTSPAMHHDLLAARATLCVGKTWLALCPGHRPEIEMMVEEVMPVVVAHGSRSLQAHAQSTLADMIASGVSSSQLFARSDQLARLLAGAAECHEATENYSSAAATWYLLAQVHNMSIECWAQETGVEEEEKSLRIQQCLGDRNCAAQRFHATEQRQRECT
eukprot:gene17095-23392_t